MRTSRNFSHSFGFVLTFLAVVAMPAFAGLNRWSGDSPGSGLVVRVIADPSDATHLYAITTGSKVVRSTDGGNTWQTASPGLSAPSFSEFISPSANTLLAGANGGVFISTDGGDHWSKAGTINGGNVAPMAFDPKSQLLYAASNQRDVYVSADIGKTWSRTSLTGGVSSLAVTAKGTVLAGTPTGLYKSSNRGRTWSVVRGGFSEVVEVDQNSAIYFFTRDSSGKQLLVMSSDEGATWRTLPLPSASPTSSVRVGDGYILNTNVIVSAPGDLFALADGIFEYTETSGEWVRVSPSITNDSPSSVAVIPSQPRKFIVSTDAGGLLVSDGNDWKRVTDGFGAAGVNDIAVVAAAPSVAVAATDSGIFRTDDRGADWKDITPSAARRSTAAQVDPGGTDVVYASTDAIYKTTDSGSSWKKVHPDPAKFLLVSPTDRKTIYAALYSALAKSSDSGDSWSNVFYGLGNYAFAYYGGPTSIDEDPSNGNTLYIACGDGALYRLLADYKWTWTNALVQRLSVAPHESVVYAALGPGGMFKTYDQGKTFTPIGLTDKQISALMLTGSNRDVLYAGTVDGRVYRTADGGTTWQGVDAALERSSITKLASDPSGKFLYAASITGVHHYEVVDIPVDALSSDALRFPRLLSAAVGNAMVVLPVAGRATGASGTSYTTDLTLTNARDSAQDVVISWLSQGGVSSFHLTLPASSDASGGIATIPDFSQSFGISGIGSLVIAGVDASGNAEPNASITASADIWSHPADQRAPFSQIVAAVTRQSAIGHATAEIRGLQHDSAFRTNVGVVNLSGQAHQYEMAIEGERATNTFTVTVPPFSLIQVPLPDADYGALTINVTADASTDWAAYASTIDRVTGEARTNIQN